MSSSYIVGGTIGWMSPELLISAERPTKQSDCYALGMVIYEVLSGQAPFAPLGRYPVMRKVMDGEHPQRPMGAEGVWFTNDLWRMLIRCWATRPEDRPSSLTVLECLERVSRDTKTPSQGWDLKNMFSRVLLWFFALLLRMILC